MKINLRDFNMWFAIVDKRVGWNILRKVMDFHLKRIVKSRIYRQ
jgi:hypothetical protein